MDGRFSNSYSFGVAFLKFLASSFRRCENQYRSLLFFSRAFKALMPSRDGNADIETIIIATAASAWCQNNIHTKSMVFFIMKPETRTMEMMIIQTLKHKKMPSKIFCRRLILTFQSNMRGNEMTTHVPRSEFRRAICLMGLRSKSDAISRITPMMLRAMFKNNPWPCAQLTALS